MAANLLPPNGLRAVIFDLDGTLRHNQPSANHVFFDLAMQLGASVSPMQRRKAFRWIHAYWASSPELAQDLQTFQSLSAAFWEHYALRSLLEVDCPLEQAQKLGPEIHRLMTENYHPEDWVPPDVPLTLQRLREAGFTLAVVSNRDDPFDELLEALGICRYFDYTLAAGEVNSWKPDPGIFQHTLQQLAIEPRQAVYLGDNYYADVIGAQRAGIAPILLDPEEIFPNADCAVIKTVGELLELLVKK